jgi:small subunit ribosomal protein S11
MGKPLRRKEKTKLVPRRGLFRIRTTFNNTIICVTSSSGNPLLWSSAGSCGFKGTRKKTPLAAKVAASSVGRRAFGGGMRKAVVVLHGPGKGRQIAIRAIHACGIRVTSIKELSHISYNGCRPPKQRRV